VAEYTKFIALVTVTKKIVWRLNKQKLVAVSLLKIYVYGFFSVKSVGGVP